MPGTQNYWFAIQPAEGGSMLFGPFTRHDARDQHQFAQQQVTATDRLSPVFYATGRKQVELHATLYLP